MRVSYLAAVWAVAGSALMACGDDSTTTPENKPDAKVSDASTPHADGGSTGDAGTMDSGTKPLDAGQQADLLASSTGDWILYPIADGGVNPATGIRGTASAVRIADGGMRLTLTVTGLHGNQMFGSHVHKLACSDTMAGGHYQNNPAPADAGTNAALYATPQNEVWLDFTTDATGNAMVSATESWIPRAGQANAIVVHEHMTAAGGVAGAKLACLSIPF